MIYMYLYICITYTLCVNAIHVYITQRVCVTYVLHMQHILFVLMIYPYMYVIHILCSWYTIYMYICNSVLIIYMYMYTGSNEAINLCKGHTNDHTHNWCMQYIINVNQSSASHYRKVPKVLIQWSELAKPLYLQNEKPSTAITARLAISESLSTSNQ